MHTADLGSVCRLPAFPACTPLTRDLFADYQRPRDSAYVSKWGGKFGLQCKSFLFFRVLSGIIFSKTLQLSGVFIKNLLGNDGIHWPIGTLGNVSLPSCTALQPCLYVHSYLFFFLIKVIYCRILLISLSVL